MSTIKSPKNLKKAIYVLILPLVVVCGLVLVKRVNKNETSKNVNPKPLAADERIAGRKKWEATPAGVMFKKWETSPSGKKVYAAEAKIRKSIMNNTNMEGRVTSLTLPDGARVGFGMMVRISDEDYILSFGLEKPGENEFRQLRNLKVNDNIIIKSHSVMHAPKYAYPIISGDYVEHHNKVIYKRVFNKNNC